MLKQFSQQAVRSERDQDFDQPVINIGSHPDNDIVIPGQGVLPFHALLMIQENKRDLVSLMPDADIRVDGEPLVEPSITVTRDQIVEIGGYTLRFQENGSPTSVRVSILSDDIRAAPLPTRYDLVPGEEAILVNVISQETDIEVQQSATYELEVVNAGPIVASFYITLQGVPDEWVEIRQPAFNLNEGQRALVNVWITPPREPTSTAGQHDIAIIVSSPNYPGHDVTTPFDITIQPYYEFALGNLSPKQQRIPWRKRTGLAHLPITNRGNSSTDFMVSALDDENGCSFDFCVNEDLQLTRQATVNIEPGGDLTLPIEITPLKQALFALRSKRYHFTTTVQVPQQISSPQTISASVTSLPLFGWWSIMLGILVILFGLFILLQPRIHLFQLVAGKDVIELGDTTKLEWSVSPFATRLAISNIDQTLNRGQKTLTIQPSKSTTYELVAGNWLSGLLGLDRKESQTVLVIPPSPNIGVFEIDKTTVDKGTPVNLRWSVTQADQVFLTIDEVVYELPQEEFSGEQEFILEKDALITLEAVNTSGSELKSFFVNVVPPHITVNAFTVWTRSPETASTTPEVAARSGGGHAASRVYVPDANFPEEYVMLIPDRSSDSGYRVEFLQPDRELAKGEQIMLEWDIDGVESVQISPFTEELPNRGVQPFFPQESMNFVMTAKSGELEQIYMLPVKVFDGIPPEAPTIDFFQGSPAKMVGAGPVEFAWSVSGEWTRVQLASGESTIADYLNPQGFKTITVGKSGTYILTAWNGPDLSTAAPFDITVDPALISITLVITSVYPNTERFMVGDEVDVSIKFTDLPDDQPYPSGDVVVSDGNSTCTMTLPATTCTLKFITPGDPKILTASYSGDDIFLQATSDPYGGNIIVSSATVNLIPTYYYLDKVNNSPATHIPDITDPQPELRLDTGLYIEVQVAPVLTTLPDDQDGKINVSICKQDPNNLEIVSGSCVFVGSVTVAVNPDGTGQADVIIRNFLNADTSVILYEYRHEQNALDPATLTEYNVHVLKKGIYLSLESCTDPVAFTGCEVGVSTPSNTKVFFDIHDADSDEYLPAALPAPPSEMFDVFEVNIQEQKTEDWDCVVFIATVQGKNVYRLQCTADFTNQSFARVNFDYDNVNSTNYYMGPDPTGDFTRSSFQLAIKNKTDVSLDTQSISGLKVGDKIQLTPTSPTGFIILKDASGNDIVNTLGDLELEVAGGTAFDLVPGSTCNLNAGTVTIGSITDDCAIFFSEQGDATLTVSFLGDANYFYSSSSPYDITIAKQEAITVTWQYSASDGSYQDWDIASWQSNTNLYVQLLLEGPAEFVPAALDGKILDLTFQFSGGYCFLDPITSAPGSNPPLYKLGIIGTSPTPYARFYLWCQLEDTQATLDVALVDQVSLGFGPGQITQRSLVIANRPTVGMESHFVRVSDGAEMIDLPNTQLKPLNLGETYALNFKVGVLWADGYNPPWKTGGPTTIQAAINHYLGTPVVVTLPNDVVDLIDTGHPNTTCQVNKTTNEIRVPLYNYTVIYDYGYPPGGTGIHDINIYNQIPCTIVFGVGAEVSDQLEAATFEFDVVDPTHYKSYNTNLILDEKGLGKQDIVIDNPLQFNNLNGVIGDPADTDTVVLTRTISGSSPNWPLDPNASFASQFGFTDPCGVISGTVTSQSAASFTLTPPSVNACSAVIEIEYKGNSWFKDSIIFSEQIEYIDAISTTTSLLSSNPNPSQYGGMVALTAQVTQNSGINTPTGTVEFKEGSLVLGTETLSSGVATLNIDTLTLGDHVLMVIYTSDSSEFGSSQSDPYTHTVQTSGTQTALASSPTPHLLGQTIQFTATVSAQAPGGGTPSGTVTFEDTTNSLPLCTAVTLINGEAPCSTSILTLGNHAISAVFTPGDSNYTTSNTSLNVEVKNETGISLSSNATNDTTNYGESVRFTAIVTVQPPGSGTPTGTVQFKNGGSNLGSPQNTVNGIATQNVSDLPFGSHTITAEYIPTSGSSFEGSTSGLLAFTVEQAATTVTLVASQTTANQGETVIFTATVNVVAPGGGTPTGSIQFSDSRGELTDLVPLNNGQAVISKTFNDQGNHNIDAAFISNTTNYINSTSSNIGLLIQ
jgi:hypothetical protein